MMRHCAPCLPGALFRHRTLHMRGLKHRDTRLLALIWLGAALLVQALFAPVHLSSPQPSDFDKADPVQVAYAALARVCNPARDENRPAPQSGDRCTLCSAALSPALVPDATMLAAVSIAADLAFARASHQTAAGRVLRTRQSRAPPKPV